jgi:hypothetical protein
LLFDVQVVRNDLVWMAQGNQMQDFQLPLGQTEAIFLNVGDNRLTGLG